MNDELKERLGTDGSIDLVVRVRPRAHSTRINGQRADGMWKIDLCVAPEDGAANELLRRFVAAEFGIPMQNVEILSGQTSRGKRLRITAPR